MTPYQFGQYIKRSVDMTSPEYREQMRGYAGQLRNQGVKNIQFSSDAKTITGINTNRPGFTPQSPGPSPTLPPAQPKPPAAPTAVSSPKTPAAAPTAVTPPKPGNVIRTKTRSAF